MKSFSFKHFFKKYKLVDVFTPSTVAKLTYVERKNVESDLIRNIGIPGLQIILYGHSGSGKSTLIINKLTELNINKIKTNCTETTTFDQLILAVFDKLNSFYKSESAYSNTVTISSSLKAKYLEIEAQIGSTMSNVESEKSQRIVPVQLTAERVSEFLGAAKCIWVIEDFHKVKEIEKKKLSQVLKVFMDTACDFPAVKIICLGAVGTARELIEYDRELSNRVTESYVPLMSNEELKGIISKGFKLMNIKTSEKDLIDKIIHYSNNLASVCHQLCYDICYSKKILHSGFWKKNIGLNDFEESVKMYIRKVSDTFNSYYDKISGRSDLKEFLIQIINLEKEVFDGLDVNKEKKRLSKDARDSMLMELTSLEMGEILRYNINAKKFTFSNPFFQAFLKMKFALERAEKQARKQGTRMELFSQNFNDIQYIEYYQIINKMMETRMKFVDNIQIELKQRKK
jgi:hypothetical protein